MTIVNLSQATQYITTLADWHQAEWSYLNPNSSIEERIHKMQLYVSDDLIPSTFIFKKDGELAGSAAIIKQDMDTKTELSPWLASVFVSPHYREKGIGSSLVNHVVRQARKAGIRKLYLFTPDKEEFYMKLGWSTISKEEYRNRLVAVMKIEINSE